MLGVWIKYFFGMHCISFDPSCWSSAVAIWNADMKMAPRHGLRMLQKIIGIRGPTKPFKMMHRSTWFGAAGRGAILMPKPLTATARAYHKIKGKESRPPKQTPNVSKTLILREGPRKFFKCWTTKLVWESRTWAHLHDKCSYGHSRDPIWRMKGDVIHTKETNPVRNTH